METNKILQKVRAQKKFTERYRLADGSIVVDTTVDEQNRLHYVIKKGNNFKVELAENNKPVENLIIREPKRIRIVNGVIQEVKIDKPEK